MTVVEYAPLAPQSAQRRFSGRFTNCITSALLRVQSSAILPDGNLRPPESFRTRRPVTGGAPTQYGNTCGTTRELADVTGLYTIKAVVHAVR